jgi:hypothetical protein
MIQEQIPQQSRVALCQDYRPCLQCKGHPHYPSIPSITLHVDGVCVSCLKEMKPSHEWARKYSDAVLKIAKKVERELKQA